MSKTRKKRRISNEALIKAWQESDNLGQVAKRLRMTKGGIQCRASRLRTQFREAGYPESLKRMKCQRKGVDIEALAKACGFDNDKT